MSTPYPVCAAGEEPVREGGPLSGSSRRYVGLTVTLRRGEGCASAPGAIDCLPQSDVSAAPAPRPTALASPLPLGSCTSSQTLWVNSNERRWSSQRAAAGCRRRTGYRRPRLKGSLHQGTARLKDPRAAGPWAPPSAIRGNAEYGVRRSRVSIVRCSRSATPLSCRPVQAPCPRNLRRNNPPEVS
jgi:hypothetical protein